MVRYSLSIRGLYVVGMNGTELSEKMSVNENSSYIDLNYGLYSLIYSLTLLWILPVVQFQCTCLQ